MTMRDIDVEPMASDITIKVTVKTRHLSVILPGLDADCESRDYTVSTSLLCLQETMHLAEDLANRLDPFRGEDTLKELAAALLSVASSILERAYNAEAEDE